DGRFLERAAVVIVQGKDPQELAAQAGGTHALVVGIDDYRYAGTGGLSRLNFAARDARTLGNVLAPRTRVDVLMNEQATRAGILEALRLLKTRVTDVDTVMLFFSGHGSTGSGQAGRPNYFLLPHDGRLDALAATAHSDKD